ncbi:MAG TPA: hypothetical protein VEY30_13815 [Myxococcaceae bacterium]|nr:hypothetical protein [Myxococcaceae bacterium]
MSTLRKSADTFHQRVRWGDLRGAAELIVPERRDAFLDATLERNDARDLKVTDYELEDARLSADGKSATVVSRLSWHRLPSVTQEEEQVTSRFVRRDETWLLVQQKRGPFVKELDVSGE